MFQFPPSFICNKENINNIVEGLNLRYMNIVEFRHKSWWNDPVYEILSERGIIFCGVSIPKDIPEDLIINHHSSLYYRLHGKPELFKSEYSEQYLQVLADKIKNSQKNSYIYFNNTWGMAAIHNAQYLQKLLASDK